MKAEKREGCSTYCKGDHRACCNTGLRPRQPCPERGRHPAAGGGRAAGAGHFVLGERLRCRHRRWLTDAEGRYAFTTITPVPYSNTPSQAADAVAAAAAALGRSLYRPAHIHYEIHHAELLKPYTGEVYFAGDPVIPVDFVGPKIAAPSLQADTVLHEDPETIAAHGFEGPFNTAVFDFVLKTRTSPDTAAVRPQGTV